MTLPQVKINCILRELAKFQRRSAWRPLGKRAVLRKLVEDFRDTCLHGALPVEGMVKWEALLAACHEKSPSTKEASREFYAWLMTTYPPPPRLHVCLESWTLVLDGVIYSNINHTMLRVIKVLYNALRNAEAHFETVFVSEESIKEKICADLGGKAIRNMRRRLPLELQPLIYAHSGEGLALILPPL